MLHINRYPVWPNGWRKKESGGFGPLSGPIVADYRADSVIRPEHLEDDPDYGVPNFLWIVGDGNTPRITPDPLLVFTDTGVITQDGPTPFQYDDGSAQYAEKYSGASYRSCAAYSLTPPDPVNDDMVIMVNGLLADALPDFDDQVYFGVTSGGNNRWKIYYNATNTYKSISFLGSCISSAAPMTLAALREFRNAPFTVVVVLDRAARRVYGYMNNLSHTYIVDNGADLSGDATGLGAHGDGTQPVNANGCIISAAVWYGAGIAGNWLASSGRLAKRLCMEAQGFRDVGPSRHLFWVAPRTPADNEGNPTKIDANGELWGHICHGPAGGDSSGGVFDCSRTVFTYRPYNPSTATGFTVTGGSVGVVADTAALAAAKIKRLGDNVYRFINGTGSDQVLYHGDAATGNSSFQIRARYVAGSGAWLGWRDTSSGVFTPVVEIADNYVMTIAENVVRPDTDCKFAISTSTGTELLFIGHQLELGAKCTSLMLNIGSSSDERSDTRGLTEYTPQNAGGSFLVNVAPFLWSGIGAGASIVLLTRTTASVILYADGVVAGWATTDGTTTIQTVAPAAPVDGVYVDVWAAWRTPPAVLAAEQYVQQDITGTGSRVTSAYDGTRGGAGVLIVDSNAGVSLRIKSVTVRSV